MRALTRYQGSAASWSEAQLPGSTAFVVELPRRRLVPTAAVRYADAVLTLARELATPAADRR